MPKPTAETLDRLYLEWSQFTEARTGRERVAADKIERALDAASQLGHQTAELREALVDLEAVMLELRGR